MADSWIEQALDGKVEIPIPSLSLTKGSGAVFGGSGRLTWKREGPIRLYAQTSGAEALMNEIGKPRVAPGELLAPSEYISLSGQSIDGSEVSAEPVPMGGYNHYVGSPYATWDLGFHDVQLRGPGFAQGRTLRALMYPCLRRWPRTTETTIDNDRFGGVSSTFDWLQVETTVGTVSARGRDRNHCEILLNSADASTSSNAWAVLNAVAAALSFVMGRLVGVAAFQERTPDRFDRVLRARPRSSGVGSLLAPIGNSDLQRRMVESLLGPTIDFFLTERGARVVDHLHLCWDTVDSAFPTQQLVASISLEGLLRATRSSAASNRTAVALDEIARIRDWLSRIPDGLAERTEARLEGLLANLSQERPADILSDWCNRGILNVSRRDLLAWRRTRNAAAHGGFIAPTPDRDKLQERITDLVLVQNLINRIVLQMAGYNGRYIDYASLDWGETDFPAAPPEEM